ncbi:exodeoxyribonuclease VII large subunit [Bovifimicola ammoniilytica]|uniref:exodeoxyribonuclease VII large subunit n=1 Tax=Bovifimicola ammoniilytica TaxID=2981720 RepID=UPI000822084E|nr:exodeoxyribonuclease VII large subunit [Bovifimicola ammoniilytica]MCU6754431.1 exodeoxyribonuclease VII large subunit [Bovifimicola ammoniilytica]SCJ85342.1 Exodeoxyribonuclease 7 large subunit [uncultured Eubacterium sp.]
MNSVYTVSQANQYIKNMFNQDFLLNNISVRGEVSNCKYHSSGHIYFSIKDRNGLLSCVMFAGKKRGLDFKMEEGNKVIVSGNINVYERDGKYQLYADKIEKEGTGDLYKRFIELKNELEEMGMFSDEYKKEIPKYSMNVGIVTASTGAAIQDIINISKRRNPYIKLVLYPAKVQGDGAADTIVNGIRCLDSKNLDVIIVGRGGGSIEDLWAFNEEKVARAIFECNTPVISAVGHETDYTIADYVADMRAPTPSAAAELVVFEYNKLCEKISSYEENMRYRIDIKIRNYRNTVNDLLWKLNKMSPANNIQSKRQRLADLEIRLYDSINRKTSERRHQLELLTERLNGLSPLNKLSGGYAYISDDKNKPVKSIKQINADDELKIVLKDGNAKVKVIDKTVFDSEF